jgi:hypothetical protein
VRNVGFEDGFPDFGDCPSGWKANSFYVQQGYGNSGLGYGELPAAGEGPKAKQVKKGTVGFL